MSNPVVIEIDEPLVTPWGYFTRHGVEVTFITRKSREVTIAIFPTEEWAEKCVANFNKKIEASHK